MSNKLSNTEKKFKEQHQKLLEKWNKDYSNGSLKEGLINPSKKVTNKKNINIKNRNCIIDEEKNPCIIERCIICKIYKPVTPLYFNIESNSKINIIPFAVIFLRHFCFTVPMMSCFYCIQCDSFMFRCHCNWIM